LKVLRQLKLVNHVALLALALCSSTGLGRAQEVYYKGKFTLPFEAHWASAVLPAGEYTISMPSTNAPYMLFVRGEGKSVVILANGWADRQLSDDSKLTVVDMDGTETIAHLEAGQLGLTFDYPLPKSHMKRMAGAKVGATTKTSAVVPVRDAYRPASGR
jgi:hypothetical protein